MTEDETDHVDGKLETASRDHDEFAELYAVLAIESIHGQRSL